MKELNVKAANGYLHLLVNLVIAIASVAAFIVGIAGGNGLLIALACVLLVVWIFHLPGFFTLQPNEAMVLILFGTYKGTVKDSGFSWVNPFMTKKKISQRARNLNGEKLKVNDQRRPWSATCSWCFAASGMRSPSSMRGPSTEPGVDLEDARCRRS